MCGRLRSLNKPSSQYALQTNTLNVPVANGAAASYETVYYKKFYVNFKGCFSLNVFYVNNRLLAIGLLDFAPKYDETIF
jgi:hypothetical protein